MFSYLVSKPFLKVKVLSSVSKDGKINDKGERLAVQHQLEGLQVLGNIQDPGQSLVFVITFLSCLEIPVCHGEQQDGFDLD